MFKKFTPLKSVHWYLKVYYPSSIICILRACRSCETHNEMLINSRRAHLFLVYKYACLMLIPRYREPMVFSSFLFLFDWCAGETLIESVLAVAAVSAARVYPDRIVSRRRHRGRIRQQRQSPSEQRGSQRNRSEQGSKRGHSWRTKGNGHPKIQVHISTYYHGLFSTSFVKFYILRINGSRKLYFMYVCAGSHTYLIIQNGL